MTQQAEQLAFPWAGETPRRRFLLDWFDFLSAYADVQKRFDASTERAAEELANAD